MNDTCSWEPLLYFSSPWRWVQNIFLLYWLLNFSPYFCQKVLKIPKNSPYFLRILPYKNPLFFTKSCLKAWLHDMYHYNVLNGKINVLYNVNQYDIHTGTYTRSTCVTYIKDLYTNYYINPCLHGKKDIDLIFHY